MRWRLSALQDGAAAVAAVSVLLSLLASAGFGPLGSFGNVGAAVAHIVLFFLGFACGLLARWRIDEIEAARWRHVEDELATQGEREYAHKEAERQRRTAGTLFLLAPTCLAFWLAQEAHLPGKGIRLSDLLLVTPLVGFFLTFLVAHRLWTQR
ncbi:MAG: hypothetical protein AAGD01_10380 [Acidobacteriota bacterium]